MNILQIPQNDKGFTISFPISNSDGSLKDLSGFSAKLKVWGTGNISPPLLSASCSIDYVTSTVSYVVGATDFPTVGVYSAEIELTQTGVIESTSSFFIRVTESA